MVPKITYNSYSTRYKYQAITQKSHNGNYNNYYYWNTKGKAKILQALANDELLNLSKQASTIQHPLSETLTELFSFFQSLLQHSNKTQKLYKKSRGFIVSLWKKLKPYAHNQQLTQWFRISESTFFAWKKRVACKITYTKECPNVCPNQLRDWERRILENDYFLNEKYFDYSIADLLGQVMADGKVMISESLFYEYATLLGETEKRKIPHKKKRYKGLRAASAKDIIHMDRTKFPIKNSNGAWANIICDNRSRAILSVTVCTSSHSKNTLVNLKQAIANHQLLAKPCWLVTDDGSENKGEVKVFVVQHPNIKHKIAQKNIPYSNSMVEALIKQLKYRYLKKKEFDSMDELTNALNIAVETYNHRPRKIHLGKTPLQVLSGDEVDVTEYAQLKELTRLQRIEENKNFNCLKAFYTSFL